ncbi:MAG: CoA-binding protein [Desulfobacteraceae bacterium 4572_35.1]|nr:MAG: CoA-binding protein [Desulfobacteraceae bacterium 4572_35.1]
MAITQQINDFLTATVFGVVGASTNRAKFGNKVLRCYQNNELRVIPVHPSEQQIEGIDCVATINDLPTDVVSISIITPPHITEKIVVDAAAKGIKNIWMQPGAESSVAIQYCQDHNINVIADGSCLLVVLKYDGH